MASFKILLFVALAVAATMAEDAPADRTKKQVYSGYYGSGYGAYPYNAAYGYSAGAYPYNAAYGYSAGAYPYNAAYGYSAGAYPYNAAAYSGYPYSRAYY
ncbi:keratin-associated protein 19-2-like [Homalodisca vitripennis]|uniref:keratin-associated protein 19-2-like n=1 Tax=Homalodisca vitripennis TaxID=197043 RepID=UPI001EEBB6EA|nr:keratin-associated protein 19-2-like [Homalodisca vitripennis]XP_046686450.1 keratin-associated protein 19-2-like [Homalodisca vitripennis]KAG8306889.1 hypothetical protein J6590_035966 [Homalodisca vitripennis]